ncbi:MAG: dihydrodipicolinate synthase family protein [Chloroflexi bacterium]|nr:dihydrodipicolinate synthase family protein [Chloroflexota bacterium]
MNLHPLHARLSGAFIAPIVPMRDDGRVDGDAVAALTRFIMAAGLAGHGGLLPASSTGEFMSLSEAEYDRVIGETVAAAGGAVPVIAGANHMDTAGAVDRARRAQRLGVDGVLVGPPFYFRPTREEVIDHFRRISDAVEIGVLVYDNTFATQLDIDEDLFAALAQMPKHRRHQGRHDGHLRVRRHPAAGGRPDRDPECSGRVERAGCPAGGRPGLRLGAGDARARADGGTGAPRPGRRPRVGSRTVKPDPPADAGDRTGCGWDIHRRAQGRPLDAGICGGPGASPRAEPARS